MTADDGSIPSTLAARRPAKRSKAAHYLTTGAAVERWLQATSREAPLEAQLLERHWGWRTCAHCGGTVMLREEMLRVRGDTGPTDECLGCAGDLR
jgi:hypothetical protein